MNPIIIASNTQDILGESPIWSSTRQSLVWIDTLTACLHCYDPKNKTTIHHPMPAPLSFIAEEPTGELLLGIGCNLARWHEHSPIQQITTAPHKQMSFRLNDGKKDAKGRLWCGIIHENLNQDSGFLYCIETDGRWRIADKNFTLINGIAWSLGNKTLFVTDSIKRVIYAYDYILSSGEISHKRIFSHFHPIQGKPDGLTIGSDDYLLSVLFDGSAIARISPDGKHCQLIKLPIPRPTSCCFDENEQYLYITSARLGLTPQMLQQFPLSGALLSIDLSEFPIKS